MGSDDTSGDGVSGALLRVDDVEVMYDRAILALRGVSLEVRAGSIVALLGANGAGKTTTLQAISRLLVLQLGEVTRGRISYADADITAADPADLVERGLVQVLEGRHCFPHLTVEENLVMGAANRFPPRRELRRRIEPVYAAFPRLRERRSSRAGYLSGGEQQMLAIGRALISKPKLILLDEPSMGLAPQVVEEIFEIVADLNRTQGVTFLIAEQNAAIALEYAHHAYVIENGRSESSGAASDLRARAGLESLYLGGDSGSASAGRRRPRRPEFALEP